MKTPSPASTEPWRRLPVLRVKLIPSLHLLLTVSVLVLPAFLRGQSTQKSWEFPWGSGYVPIEVSMDEAPVDGHVAQSIAWSGNGLQFGGPMNPQWSATASPDASLRLSLSYSPDMQCALYLYPTGVYAPSNIGDAFADFARQIAMDAQKLKSSQVVFVQNEDGTVKIHPDPLINKRSIFYDPDSKTPQGTEPLILGQPYFELRYTFVRNKTPMEGIALFVTLPKGVFCVSLESTCERFDARVDLLKQYLDSLYLVRQP